MSSLSIVGCGKENMHTFIALLQNEIKAFIKQNNASFYNLKTLWKAETSTELLKKNAHVVFPCDDANREYWGFFNVEDYDALYSVLFSSAQIAKSNCSKQEYYTPSHLKSLLKQIVTPCISRSSLPPYDFRIVYHSELINDSKRMCTLRIDINDTCLDSFDFFQHFVYKLDTFSPNIFLSACIDESSFHNFDFKFDNEMLTRKIINLGKAFYVSNKLEILNHFKNETTLHRYVLSQMNNGTWFAQSDMRMETNCDWIKMNDLLIPQYMVINWSDLSDKIHLRITDFDTISVYYDKYSPLDPTLIFSRGYSSIQLDILSKELGDLILQEKYPANVLLADL